MANTDKDIVITPNRGSSTADPSIRFTGGNASVANSVNVSMYADGTLSFDGTAGQLFSITNSLTGTIFSVNDVSGIPSIEVTDSGIIRLAQYNGNVGIGTATPSSTLHVQGNVLTTGYTQSGSFIPTSSTVPSNGLFYPTANRISLATNTTERVTIDSNGNVGVNQTSPTTLVDIKGSIKSEITSTNSVLFFKFDPSGSTPGMRIGVPVGPAISPSNPVLLTVGTNDINGNTNFGGAGSTTSIYAPIITQSSGVDYGVNVFITASNFSTPYGVSATINSTASTTTAYGIYSNVISTGTAYAFYSARGLNYFNGNVGIATTSPSQPLHVQGVSYLNGNVGIGTSTFTAGNVLAIAGSAQFTGTMYGGTYTGTWNGAAIGTAYGGTGLSGATPFNANGIVYATSTSALTTTAQGGANTILVANAGAPSFSATPTIGTSLTVPIVYGGTAASSSLTLQSTSGAGTTDSIIFKVGNAGAVQAMTINTSGYVGIGTTSPSYLIDARSALSQLQLTSTTGTNTSTARMQNTGGLFTVGIDSSASFAYASYAGIVAHSGSYPIIFATASAEKMRLDSAGSLGIGTTGPAATLHVVGTHVNTGNVGVGTASTTGIIAGNVLAVFGNTQFANQVFVNSTTQATSTTSAALSVVGGIATQGNLYAGGDIYCYGGDYRSITSTINIANFVSQTVYFAGNATVVGIGTTGSTGTVTFNPTTLSSSTTTGAVVIKGGLGVAGNIYAGGNIYTSGANGNITGVSSLSAVTVFASSSVGVGTTSNAGVTTGNALTVFGNVNIIAPSGAYLVNGVAITAGGGGGVTSFSAGTTGFTPSTATTGAVTLAGNLSLTNGGTNASLTASNGGVVYSTATAMAILAGTATAGQHLQSGATGAPSWTTATFPSTATGTGTILRANGTNWVASTVTYTDTGTSGGIPYYSSASAISSSGALAASAIVVGGGAGVAPSTITTGTGVVTALGVNTGSAGAFVVNGGALGIPSSGNLISCTSLPLTTGVTGTLGLTNGGTNASLTASNGGIIYSTASAFAVLAATATAGQHLQSGASGAPSWTTATFPSTATGTGTILRANGTNWIASTLTYVDTAAAGTMLVAATANTITASATPTLGAAGTTAGTLTLSGATSGTVTLKTAAAAGTSTQFQLPASNGTVDYVLRTDGSGNTSWVQVSLTAGVTGTLPIANGGTNGTATPTTNGVAYGTGTAYAFTAAGTTGQILTATTSGAPSWGLLDLSISAPDSSYKKIADAATIGTNITLAGGAPSTLDGVTLALNSRVLVKDQTAPAENGIYYVTTLGTGANGTWTRSVDADASTDIDGATISVSKGTVNGGRRYITYFKGTDTLGTTAMYWNRLVDAYASSQAAIPTTASGIDIAVGGDTVNLATGSIADLALNSFTGRTITATGASTYTRAATMYISGAPTASTNATFTNSYALYVAGGATAFVGGTVALGANGGTGGSITFNGATSGSSTVRVAAAAGTGTVFQFPATNGTNGWVLTTDGSGNTSWAAASGGGATITDDNATNTTQYPTMARATSGTFSTAYTASSDLYFNPSTGTLSSIIFNSLSDISVKENILTINDATDVINSLRGVGFTWKRNGKKSYGVIAQELEAILPDLVDINEDDGTKSVNYAALTGFFIEAIKDLNEKVESLTKIIETLK